MKKINEVPLRGNDDGYHGRVYESIRGVRENNSKGPDLLEDSVELKSKKPNSASRTTLFSMEPRYDIQAGISKSKEMLLKYRNAVGKLNTTLTFGRPNNRGFYLDLSPSADELLLCNTDLGPIARWNMAKVEARISEKMPNLDMAIFEEDLSYTEDRYRGFLIERFRDLLQARQIVVDIRMRDGELSGNTPKNRGTAFRISTGMIGELYQTKVRIERKGEKQQ